MVKKSLLFCIGTRPEAIKLAPLVLAAQKRGHDAKIISTGQHREMLTPIFTFFKLAPFVDLSVLEPGQTLANLTSSILNKFSDFLKTNPPDLLFVQGDTTSAFSAALAAFYEKIPVAHVEAGLRTNERYSPFPEEMSRILISSLALYHFAPTETSKENLLKSGIHENVWVTGNTGIDALRIASDVPRLSQRDQKTILVTCHRRENHGSPLEEICQALLEIAEKFEAVQIIFPVHLNPNVMKTVHSKLSGHPRIKLMEPVSYPEFSNLMKDSYLMLTDSGGIQEEAPYFKKPILVMRDSTERPEGIAAHVAELVGTKCKKIVDQVSLALQDPSYYASFQTNKNPYGDGFSSDRILNCLEPFLS